MKRNIIIFFIIISLLIPGVVLAGKIIGTGVLGPLRSQATYYSGVGSTFIYADNSTGFIWSDSSNVIWESTIGKKIILTDSAGKNAWAYPSSVGSGLTVSNKWTSDFSAGVDGITASQGTVDGNIDGIGGQDDNLRYTINTVSSDAHYVKKLGVMTVSGLNRVRVDYYLSSANSDMDGIRLRDGSNWINSVENTTDSWTNIDVYHTATDTEIRVYGYDGASLLIEDVGGDDVFYCRNTIIDQVTDIPTNQGAHVVTTYGGATKGWNYDSGFNWNSITNFTVRRWNYPDP